jgi:5-methylthioadenosine/S-adenosylhomocysteine deaminase
MGSRDRTAQRRGSDMTSVAAQRCDIIIRNAYLITMDPKRTIYDRGAVAIAGHTIAAVGPDADVLARYRAERLIDVHGAPVHPGFVEAHYHIPNHLTRGVFPDASTTAEYYVNYAKWYDRMDEEDEHAAGLIAGLEMLRSGITCFMEAGTVFATDAVASAALALGIRASVSEPFLWDIGKDTTLSNMRRSQGSTERCLDQLGRELWRNRDPDALVRGHVCLFGSGSASDDLIVAGTETAERNGVAFTQHQSTNVQGVSRQEERLGRRPLVHFADVGVLKPHCAYTHMNVIREDEARAIKEAGMSIIWCPANSMNWGIGATIRRRPQPDLYRQGVNVGLGSDVPKWGLDAAPLTAYLLARDLGDSEPLASEEIFEMATLGGAQAMGLAATIGSLEPGKRADLVIRSSELPEFQPGRYPIQNLLLASRGKSVDTVLVDGQIMVRGGHSTRVDEQVVYERAKQSAMKLAQEIGIAVTSRWPVLSGMEAVGADAR